MSKKDEIFSAQRTWATGAGFVLDTSGYLPRYEDNPFRPMNPSTKAAFEQGSGSELTYTPRSPAKMRAVHSSSALAVNVFDSWVGVANVPLLKALGVDGGVDALIRFEGQYPTGLPRNPPNLDVVVEFPAGPVIGIESKFTEWLTARTPRKVPFKDKYFPADEEVWAAVGLARSQHLAERLKEAAVSFRLLDAPQLLKHALGLATHLGDRFRLYYLYFDCSSAEGEYHREEVKRFADTVGAELKFQALSYQELFKRLVDLDAGSANYRKYLQARYFSGAGC